MKAMSPGVVDFLFRQLVAGRPPVDIQWQDGGVTLTDQPAGAELARRLADTDLDALTPTELFHYVRAAQRLAAWPRGCGRLRWTGTASLGSSRKARFPPQGGHP
ncbi:hypothetical protein AHiyo4_17230 [Arthrobacter sp. Hiyo4]|nr:hypothetical protein AHiyo4_17230 [Arthrobacter sp. Hiyo4]